MSRMRMYTWIVPAIFFFGWQTAGIAEEPTVTGSQGAISVINTFHAALLFTMQHAKSLGYRGRYARLEPTIRQNYDFSKVVRVTAGKYWRDLNHDQKVRFLYVFSRLVIATYAHRFDGYSGESFQTVSTRASGHGRVIVRTVLIKRNGSRVHLDYLLRQRKGQWLIVNVIAQGVSDLALKRVEYTTVLRSQGFDALMTRLEEKITQYE
ncbi:MAG: ABC transporter substrate-binding protein [Mariprofundaceae bacterium]|nr:ABC transporter substrate-binding protein [Mariprofundaceae bacterium]